jgi:hypothetical protein
VAAVAEATLWSEALDLNKPQTPGVEPIYRRGEVAHSRRVDQVPAVWQVKHPGRRRGVASFLFPDEVTDLNSGAWNQAVHER